jgi:NAD(P)-dependent dehydrogenase (short-subunit alcohol dehydrogenase family)
MQKIVLITGGSKGIGKATGEFLTTKGYKVYGTSRDPEKINNHSFPLLKLDVTDLHSIKSCIDGLKSKEGRIDVLINNAGAGITGAIEEVPDAELRRNFETNLFGPIAVMREVIPLMRTQGNGLIINVTSIAGYMGLPYRGVYSASKGALELLSEAVSMEVKPYGIEVVNFAPGDVATDIASGRYHVPLNKKSPYYSTYKNTLELMDNHVDSGRDPLIIARALHHIIGSKNKKLHYKVAQPLQKFSIVLKRILPDRWYERMLMNHYKM